MFINSLGPTPAQRKALNEVFNRRDLYVHELTDERATHAACHVLQSLGYTLVIEMDCTGASRSMWRSKEGNKYFCDGDLIVRRLDKAEPFTPSEPVNGYMRLSRDDFMRRANMHGDTVMLEWLGMTLGIEPDGYTHS